MIDSVILKLDDDRKRAYRVCRSLIEESEIVGTILLTEVCSHVNLFAFRHFVPSTDANEFHTRWFLLRVIESGFIGN